MVALAALGLTAWRMLAPSGASCQEQAWNVEPAEADLPAGLDRERSQYDVSRKQMSFVGPIPVDEVSTQAVVYATVTCFAEGAEDRCTCSQQAAETAGQSVIVRTDLGDQSFSAVDETGAEFLQLRHGTIVVYLARPVTRRPPRWTRSRLRSTRHSAGTAARSRRRPSSPPMT